MKLNIFDYVGRGNGHAKFGCGRLCVGFWANRRNVRVKMSTFAFLFFFISFTDLQVEPQNRFLRLMAQTTRLRTRWRSTKVSWFDDVAHLYNLPPLPTFKRLLLVERLVGTNLIHDFTAVTFCVKLAVFREKCTLLWNAWFFVNFSYISESFRLLYIFFYRPYCIFCHLVLVTLQRIVIGGDYLLTHLSVQWAI